jgi:uncharacterized membrane protein
MAVLHRATPERLSAFSDGVFAVPRSELSVHRDRVDQSSYLMRYATEATPRLLWFNFAHLFSMSLLPLSTAWMAVSRLAPQPVAFYAAVFFFVNATYICLTWELVHRRPVSEVPSTVRRIMRFRSITTLCLFGVAALVALKYPLAGLGICTCCLIVYLRPDPPGVRERPSQG